MYYLRRLDRLLASLPRRRSRRLLPAAHLLDRGGTERAARLRVPERRQPDADSTRQLRRRERAENEGSGGEVRPRGRISEAAE